MSNNQKTWAFVLAGGGASAAYQAGVMCELSELGVKPSHAFTNSAGTLNGIAMSYQGEKGLSLLWKNIKSTDSVFKKKWAIWTALLFNAKSIYTSDPLRELLKKTIEGKTQKFPITFNATNLITGAIERFTSTDLKQDELIEMAIASATIPGILPPVRERFADGGIRENVPLSRAIKSGYENIILILNDPLNTRDRIRPCYRLSGIREIAARAIELLLVENYAEDIKLLEEKNKYPDKYKKINLHVFAPKSPNIGVMDFEPLKIEEAFRMGQTDATEYWNNHGGIL